MWALCIFYYYAAAVMHLHNIVRPTLGLQVFCLDVIPTFQSEKKYLAPLQPSSEEQYWDSTGATERSELLLHHVLCTLR